jgi:hypothetical protein
MIKCDHRGTEAKETIVTCGGRDDLLPCASFGQCFIEPLCTKAQQKRPDLADVKNCHTCEVRTVDGVTVGKPSQAEIRQARLEKAKADSLANPKKSKDRLKRELERQIAQVSKADHGQVDGICRSQLNTDVLETNPSIIRWRERNFLAYQQNEDNPHLFFAELGPAWEPFGPADCRMVNNHAFEENRLGRELPKLFEHQREIWMYYTGEAKDSAGPILARLNHFGEVSYEQPVLFSGSAKVEPDWAFWSDGTLRASYTIHPHVVLTVSGANAKVESVSGWDMPVPGRIVSAASPLFLDGHWYCFVSVEDQGVQSLHLGVWEEEAPYRVVKFSRRALLLPHADWAEPVLTPGGAILIDGTWRVAIGAGGSECKLAVFEHEKLIRELVDLDAR